jgi:hypothetical protein
MTAHKNPNLSGRVIRLLVRETRTMGRRIVSRPTHYNSKIKFQTFLIEKKKQARTLASNSYCKKLFYSTREILLLIRFAPLSMVSKYIPDLYPERLSCAMLVFEFITFESTFSPKTL